MFKFVFGRKSQHGREFSIDQIPLFAGLSANERRGIESKLRLTECKKGDVIYSEGDDAEAFYIICSGRFRLYKEGPGDVSQTLSFLYRGEYFGEISLLTGNTHSVCVESVNDSMLFKLDKEDFHQILKDCPSLSIHLSRSLSMRLRRGNAGEIGETKIASFFAMGPADGLPELISNFVFNLRKESKKSIFLIDLSPNGDAVEHLIPKEHRKGLDLDVFSGDENDLKGYIMECPLGIQAAHLIDKNNYSLEEKGLKQMLSLLLHQASNVIVYLPHDLSEMSYKIISQSDLFYLLSNSERDSLEQSRSLTEELKKSANFSADQVRLLIQDADDERNRRAIRDIELIAQHKVFRLIPNRKDADLSSSNPLELTTQKDPFTPYARAIRYLAREFSGNLVGLVLSSGAAHGIAHIGVLKVIEHEDIPIDVISGSSMGALIGALWSSGWSAAQLEAYITGMSAKKCFHDLIGFKDFSLPHKGFFKGKQMEKYLNELFQGKTFRDFRIPVRVIATNLYSSEEEVFESGDVADAIRASISIPGIFHPVKIGGKTFTDGGVIDPLPVKVMTQIGVKRIIAVNVLSSPEDIMQRKEYYRRRHTERLRAVKGKGWFKEKIEDIRSRLRKRYATNIFNVIMSTTQFMEYAMAEAAGSAADVVIHPTVIDASWIEFYEAEKFIEAGEREARKMLPEIRKLIEE